MIFLNDGLRNTVGRFCDDLNVLARVLYGLVMEGVDPDLGFTVDFLQDRTFFDREVMPRIVSRVFVTEMVLKFSFDLKILIQGSACSHVHDLDAAADAEDRFFDLIHKVLCNCDIMVIALRDDRSAVSFGRSIVLLRSYIVTAGNDHSVQFI